MNIYISKFKEGNNYLNDKRIEMFNETFNTNFSSSKISRIIKPVFKISKTRINGKQVKMFQIYSQK
jgi:hypothetical protein